MGLDDGSDFWSEQRSGDFVDGKITMSTIAACRGQDPSSVASPFVSANIAEQGLMGDWSLFASMAQHMDFNGFTAPSSSNVCAQENDGVGTSGGSFVEQMASLPCFNSRDISQIMSSTALAGNGQPTGPLSPDGLNSSDDHGIEKNSKGKKGIKMPECGAFDSQSPFSRIQTAEVEQKKDVIPDSIRSPRVEDVKTEKGEQKPRGNTHKLTSKQAKENSSKGDAPEDYIHLRAKRGHATNSHSLAERVRRQKISERMKFLQDLVPGCSKITGKAVMLDEIINYIQSLQRQVEFLSMKLATVNPEFNLDIEKILSKDVLHSHAGGSAVLGFFSGFSSSHLHSRRLIQKGVMQAEMAIDNDSKSREELKSTLSEISSLAQISNIWQDDLENIMPMDCAHSRYLDARTDPPGSTET